MLYEYEYNGYLKPFLPTILKLAREGKESREIAIAIGKGNVQAVVAMIDYIRRGYGIPTIVQMKRSNYDRRNREIVERYRSGKMTIATLAKKYGLSRARVSQIIVRQKEKEYREESHSHIMEYGTIEYDRMEDIPLKGLCLSARTYNCLRFHYDTVGEVMQVSNSELLSIPNFGKTSLAEWEQFLQDLRETWKSS